MDRRTTRGFGVDGKTALHEFQSLLHVVETKPSARLCRFEVKAYAAVPDREMNLIRRCPQSHIELSYPAMLHCIVRGLL